MDEAVPYGQQGPTSSEEGRGSEGATADGSSGVSERHPKRSQRLLIAVATVGALLLVAYAYGAFRWGGLGDVEVLALLFGVLLLGYAALAVFGVRAGVVAPFVVAALLLPWACGAAAFLGATQRVVSVVDDVSNEFSLEDSPTVETDELVPTDDVLENADGDITAQPSTEARPTTTPLGDPVAFSTAGELGQVQWEVTVTDLECGITSLPRAEVSDDSATATTATPSDGNEFCLLQTKWKNVGDVESMPVFPGNLIIDGEEVPHGQIDQGRSFAVTSDRLGVDNLINYVDPGKSVKEIEVYEVPKGSAPEAVWIAFHDPKALAATA